MVRFDDSEYARKAPVGARETIGSFVFEPYREGLPVFVLTLWDTHQRDRYGKFILAYRLSIGGCGAPDRVLFEGADFATPNAIDSNETVAGIMGFLTLKPGDTDDDYFANYTPEQLAYCGEHAEALAFEVECRYGER